MIKKKNTYKVCLYFLLFHLIIWTLVPSITNVNLPLDTIEALAWGSSLDWGYNKHPPLSALMVEIFFKLFGNQDWAYYLLSQIFITTSFLVIFKFAIEFFEEINLAFISVLLLEGLFFFNYTSPEFNVNISQLPFWSLSIFFTWQCIKKDNKANYVFLGLCIGLGFLSKYLFLYLILGIKLLFIFLIVKREVKSFNFLLTGIVAFLVVLPHIVWLFENNFITIFYGLQRTGGVDGIKDYFTLPIIFLLKQIILLIPLFFMTFFLVKDLKLKKINMDKKMIFLLFTFLIPIILLLITSIIVGGKIRTMWMTPFYLFTGVIIVQIYKKNIDTNNLKKFFYTFLFFFILSPLAYSVVSLTNEYKRTDYPGREIARLVQNRWNDNFSNEIKYVVGDEWFAGNLSYHLISRPKWVMELKEKSQELKTNEGVIYTGNPKILKNICPGVFGTIKPVGYCMIGQK